MAKTFEAMSREERIELVRKEMKIPGNSNKKVAKKYGVNPGVIAGIRHREKIPSTNKVPSMGKPQVEQPPAPSTPLEEPSGRAYPVRPKFKLAASEKTQCKAYTDGTQCGYERLPGSEYCGMPQHQAQEQKMARR